MGEHPPPPTSKLPRTDQLNRIFSPKAVAVVGASGKVGSVGAALMKNMLGSGYEGIVHPVNPQRDSVFGVKAYPSVLDLPDQCDLAILAIPARRVPAAVQQCGLAGVAGIVIISSGFAVVALFGN